MFGYIRPLFCELKMRESEQYKAVYCGLCHTLSRRYGMLARLLVNYDFLLPAMLFRQTGGCSAKKRCVRHPFRGCYAVCEEPAMEYTADALMVFTDWKLRDTLLDGKGLRIIAARMTRLLYRKAFQKAAKRLPEETVTISTALVELERLEQTDDYMQAADAFGVALSCLSFYTTEHRRAAQSLFRRLGRWIYLADAYDDAQKDMRSGNHNPINTAFGQADGQLPESARDAIGQAMVKEQDAVLAAYALLPDNAFSGITENILSHGLHARGHKVLFQTEEKR